jgi:hypothetical protein
MCSIDSEKMPVTKIWWRTEAGLQKSRAASEKAAAVWTK